MGQSLWLKFPSVPHWFYVAHEVLFLSEIYSFHILVTCFSFPFKSQTPTPFRLSSEWHMYLILPDYLWNPRLWLSCTYIIKLWAFLLLIHLMSIWFLDQLEEPGRVEEISSFPAGACRMPDVCLVRWWILGKGHYNSFPSRNFTSGNVL